MPLSSNALIHFTDSKEKLKAILEDNFRISYCKEAPLLGGDNIVFYAPMVSFCDIPLSELKDHISKYGNYGIGLTKRWGETKGLNPVLYVARNSTLSASYLGALRHYSHDVYLDDLTEEQIHLVDVMRYIKSYEGSLTRKGTTIPNYRFSDEREWRYVPPYSDDFYMLFPEDYCSTEEDKVRENHKLSHLRLQFEPNDIKYIIINDDSEISEFVSHLRDAKGKKYLYHDVERLMTRLLTVEQIKEDM